MQALVERIEHYDVLKSLACPPAGTAFGQVANGDVDNVKKGLERINAKKWKELPWKSQEKVIGFLHL